MNGTDAGGTGPHGVGGPPVEVFGARDVPPSVTWQAVTLMRTEWPGLFDGGLRWVDRPFPPEMAPVHVVARHEEVLLSHAVVVPIPPDVHDAGLDVVGVASVLTSPPYRGEGHATAVLTAVNGLLDAGTADVAVLFCDAGLVPFYARLGWEPCPGGTFVGEAGDPSVEVRMARLLSGRGRAARARVLDEPLRVAWEW